MKKLTIKMRMTLWYSALMLLLVAVVLGFMAFVSDNLAAGSARAALTGAVEANLDEVEYDDGELEIDDDFAYLSGGVSSVVYTAGGELAAGHLPEGFATTAALEDGTVRSVSAGGRQFYIYDRLLPNREYGDLWIRGVVAADGSTGILGTVTTAAFILLPFIVLVAALVGYQIARRAFAPIEQITRAANAIGEGSDLSRRINLGDGRDEIHRLAATFDGMFARLEASFEEERQFSSDVSHELRTPTAVILSQCEYALAHAATAEEYREAVETVERQAQRMSRLITQLLAYTRLEQGVDKAAFEQTDLSELVTLVCEEQAAACPKSISLEAEVEPGICVEADRSMLVRLLSNLIANACQYGRQGGRVTLRLWREAGGVRLSVADDGIGIPPEHLGRIWNRFYQVDPARSPGQSGSMGLGLAMVSQIARLHGGRMEVQSTPGAGSVFTLVLPAGRPAP